ncbi:hypothetical protein LSAT2_027236 [Lamellibrachia satsuma]|nr:hypothetical protein LSAT2_027236 [Lamellibrachia satsuma]
MTTIPAYLLVLMMSTLLASTTVAQSKAYTVCMNLCEAKLLNCIKKHHCATRFPLLVPQCCMDERLDCFLFCEETFP